MLLETVFIGIVTAYLHKKVKFYLIKKKKWDNAIMNGAEPFFIDNKSKTGILLLHGFTSTPQEVKGIGEYLAKKGLTIYAPLLTGHGTHIFDLATTKRQDWEKSTIKAFNRLKKKAENIFVIGSSMGGNLAIKLANQKKVKGLILLGTPMFFKSELTKKIMLKGMSLFKNFVKKKHDKRAKRAIKKKVHYMHVPIKALKELAKVIQESEDLLPNTKVPALVMQSATDQILTNENAELIYNRLGSKIKEKEFIPDSYHVFCLDKNKEIAFKKINEFIKKISSLKHQ